MKLDTKLPNVVPARAPQIGVGAAYPAAGAATSIYLDDFRYLATP